MTIRRKVIPFQRSAGASRMNDGRPAGCPARSCFFQLMRAVVWARIAEPANLADGDRDFAAVRRMLVETKSAPTRRHVTRTRIISVIGVEIRNVAAAIAKHRGAEAEVQCAKPGIMEGALRACAMQGAGIGRRCPKAEAQYNRDCR